MAVEGFRAGPGASGSALGLSPKPALPPSSNPLVLSRFPAGPVGSNRLQQGPRPANSLISAVRNTAATNNSGGGRHGQALAQAGQSPQPGQLQQAPGQHPLPLLQHQSQQQALQHQQHQQQLMLLGMGGGGAGPSAALGNAALHARGVAVGADQYASSPEVQRRPHSITSHAADTRGDGHGHAGGRGGGAAGGAAQAPGHTPRQHPARSIVRGTTPASVHGQLQAPGGRGGASIGQKTHQHSLQVRRRAGGGAALCSWVLCRASVARQFH